MDNLIVEDKNWEIIKKPCDTGRLKELLVKLVPLNSSSQRETL